MLDTLVKALPTLAPIDQMGLVADQLQLGRSGYQPMGRALDLLAAVPGNANPVVAAAAINHWASLHGALGRDPASQARLAALAARAWSPRLNQLGLDPRDGESLADADLRAMLVAALGSMGDPAILAAARARFAALDGNPAALDGPLKTGWLTIVARGADAAQWDKLARLAAAAKSPVEKAELYVLLGAAKDPALARRALALALTEEPGKTTSAAILTRVADLHASMAFDFVLANQARVTALVDAPGRGRFIQRIADDGDDPAIVPKLERYAAGLAPDARKTVANALSVIRDRIANTPRIAAETAAWLAARDVK